MHSTIRTRDTSIRRTTETSGGLGGGQSLRMALASLGGSSTIAGAVREVATDPNGVIANRAKEKKDLQDLNDRFATYIEKVRFYEAENKRLLSIIETLKVKYEKLDETMRGLYENELQEARKIIDQTTKAKGAVELKVDGLERDLAEYKQKYEIEVREHTVTKQNIPALEKAVSERDAQINHLVKNVDSMERELTRYKNEVTKLRREISDSRTNVDGEIVARVELESQLQSKDDEINFLKNIYEEKLRVLMDFDAGDYQEMFSNELALALRDIRAEYESIAEAQRQSGSGDGWYKAKFEEIMTSSQRAGNELSAAKEEVKNVKAKYSAMSKEMSAMKAMSASSSSRVAELEAEMSSMSRSHELEMEEKSSEINSLRAQLAAQIMELKELMDSKLALDAEIATYRRLLQSEETRTKNVGAAVVQTVVGGSAGGAARRNAAAGGAASGSAGGAASGGNAASTWTTGPLKTVTTTTKGNAGPVSLSLSPV